jgi:hypothetical protein
MSSMFNINRHDNYTTYTQQFFRLCMTKTYNRRREKKHKLFQSTLCLWNSLPLK